MSGLTIEVITYFNLLDISTLSSNTSAIRGPAAFFTASDSQLTTQTLASERALDSNAKKLVISSSSNPYRPVKSPRIHEISDDETPSTRSTATSQQLKEVRNRRSSERESLQIGREITAKWRCQKMNCHNFEQGTCWIAYDAAHIQLLSSEIASWIEDIERGKAIVETPSRKMTRRLMDRKEKKNQKKDEPTTITNPSIQTLQMPTVIFPPSIPAAPASTSSNTAFPSEIINVMMMKYMMEGIGGLNSKPQPHYYSPSNPPSNPPDPLSNSSAKSTLEFILELALEIACQSAFNS
ncbi:hypothetical protein ACJ73_07523 [Blastomyces percursus]|uniref:Uncharacterized protein n=1 Tax=Blastomyces percursus TaxID=1658174 RepID=A0A1J9R0P9_9EURO|nr:hypothetical protein ACJ73_07523 [Blastomyces percursus]